MNTIQQTVEVSFHHVSIADAVVMLPVMDNLANDLKATCSAIDTSGMTSERHKRLSTLYNQLEVMAGLGFVTSCGNADLPDREYIHQLLFGHE